MARPIAATVFATTPGGIEHQWVLDDLRSRGARDASAAVVQTLVAEPLVGAFLAEAVGFAQWDGTSPVLNRTLPLACPIRAGLWCEDYNLVDTGVEVTRTNFNDPLDDNRPTQDWHLYSLTFTRPRWWVRSNTTLATTYENREQERFCTVSEMPRPRERVVSGYGFEYLPFGRDAAVDANWVRVPEERQFVPDWQIDLVVTLVGWPIGAPPYGAILNRLNTVNATPIRFATGGRIWPPESLLYKGLARPYEMYFDAADNPVYDLAYRFTVQPGGGVGGVAEGGWNKYPSRNAAGAKVYLPVRVFGAKTPPYERTEFQDLFRPGAA